MWGFNLNLRLNHKHKTYASKLGKLKYRFILNSVLIIYCFKACGGNVGREEHAEDSEIMLKVLEVKWSLFTLKCQMWGQEEASVENINNH